MNIACRCFVSALTIVSLGSGMAANAWAFVIRDNDRVFIVDRTGEQWDVTQAVSLGFDPRGFQFGIGRDAIQPLDESHLQNDSPGLGLNERIIGVENGPDAQAYVVRKMTRHEIANTTLGQDPIAAAY